MKTLVIQSYRTTQTLEWISTCLNSVRSWAADRGYDYRLYGDEIFDRVPDWYREKTRGIPQIATDLCRLHLLQEALDTDFERAVWLDADVLITASENLVIDVTSGFTLGREIWVQPDKTGRPRAFKNVHNAYMVFCRNNAFLPFYRESCQRIIRRLEPGPGKGMTPQIVGPKLLTSLHNTLGFDLSPDIAMLSPDVLSDIVAGGGDSLNLFRQSLAAPALGANLCASLAPENVTGGIADNDRFMETVCAVLMANPEILHPA